MKIINAEIRVPSVQYGYISLNVEGTLEEVLKLNFEAHRAYTDMGSMIQITETEGLDKKEWQATIDSYLDGQGMLPDVHERMNKAQKWFISEIDRSRSRLNYEKR